MRHFPSYIILCLSIAVSASVETAYLPVSTNALEVVVHQDFTLGYNEDWEQAAWVVERLTTNMFADVAERKDNFKADKAITTGSAAVSDYAKTGFDKGHLAPAADFAYSQESTDESFLMSNMSPQVPRLNRGRWATLEDWVRDATRREKSLVVVTGPVITGEVTRIGKNGVAVPHGFYKALLDLTPPCKTIGFFYANVSNGPLAVADHAVNIDDLERLTGLDFFASLPESEQTELESVYDFTRWQNGDKSSTGLVLIVR